MRIVVSGMAGALVVALAGCDSPYKRLTVFAFCTLMLAGGTRREGTFVRTAHARLEWAPKQRGWKGNA